MWAKGTTCDSLRQSGAQQSSSGALSQGQKHHGVTHSVECHEYFNARHGSGDRELLTDDHEQENDRHQCYDCFHLQGEHRGVLHRVPCIAAST